MMTKILDRPLQMQKRSQFAQVAEAAAMAGVPLAGTHWIHGR
jgi:hypothetical protein